MAAKQSASKSRSVKKSSPKSTATKPAALAPGSYASPAGDSFYVRDDGAIFVFERKPSDMAPFQRSKRIEALPADAEFLPTPPPLPVEEPTVVCADCGGDAGDHATLRADNKVVCSSCVKEMDQRPQPQAVTTRVSFCQVLPDVKLFSVEPGVPVGDALNQLSLILGSAADLLSNAICADVETSKDSISGIEFAVLAAKAVGEAVQEGLLEAQKAVRAHDSRRPR